MLVLFSLLILTIVLLFIFGVIFIVQQQTICIIERFGKYVGYAGPGLNVKLPFPISVIAQRISLRISQSEHDLQIKTKDNAFVKLPVKVQLRVLPDRVEDAFYKLDDPEEQINSFILNIVRSKAATLDLEEIYTKKSEIAEHVSNILEEKIATYGHEIIDVLVDEPEPSQDVQESYNNVIASKRELEAAHNQAAAKKTLLVGEAEAEAESLELKATSYAIQRKTITKGIREALNEIESKNLDHRYILEYISGIDYRDTIRDASRSESNTLIFSNDPAQDLKKLTPLLTTKMTEKTSKEVSKKKAKEEVSSTEAPKQESPWEDGY